MNKIGLVAFDLDGTLLDSRKKIRRDVLHALTEIQTSGIFVTLITGRSYSATIPYARQLALQIPFGLFHGALVKDLLGLELLKRTILPGGVREAIRLATIHRCIPMILGTEGQSNLTFCTEDQDHPVVEYIIEVEKNENPAPEVFFRPRAEIEMDAYAIYMMGHPKQIDAILDDPMTTSSLGGGGGDGSSHPVQSFQIEKFPVNASEGNSAIKERYQVAMLSPLGANKSVALTAIAESLGIPMKEVLAFGDWHNDIPMLETAGYAVLMGNAPAAVVAKLDHPHLFRTGTNDGSGVVDGLRRFGLI